MAHAGGRVVDTSRVGFRCRSLRDQLKAVQAQGHSNAGAVLEYISMHLYRNRDSWTELGLSLLITSLPAY